MASHNKEKITEKELKERLKNGRPLTREEFLKRMQKSRGQNVKPK